MLFEGANLYARWRSSPEFIPLLHSTSTKPAERLLQVIWHHQRLQRDRLHTIDGRSVKVLHPGFWSHEGGPDFRRAVIQIDNETPITGDIELDLEESGWQTHGHDRTRTFNHVILHVIWGTPKVSKTSIPTLNLMDFLDSPIADLEKQLAREKVEPWPQLLHGNCSSPLSSLGPEALREVLEQAAQVRLQRKAETFIARSKQVGWAQTFWEGLFRALGYKQNGWAMEALARSLPQLSKEAKMDVTTCQAELLGMSGLLEKSNSKDFKGNNYLRSLWDHWWRERERLREFILPLQLWTFAGVRPANHPIRRLALAAHWLVRADLQRNVESWILSDSTDSLELEKFFQVSEDPFWSHHWTPGGQRLIKPQPLLGPQRFSDIVINVVLPLFWARAVLGENHQLRERVQKIFFAWPGAEDNSVLKMARQRLLKGCKGSVLKTSAMQQGLFQIVRDFCDHSDALCSNCEFPALVKAFSNQRQKDVPLAAVP
ncbi:MAG: hypothetical protein JWN25_837 [Verrucomicrobiales bacterium]|nr:hypothetical protein [Verrucomicrobiales bacterium]